MAEDDFWKKVINGLDIPFPDIGVEAPKKPEEEEEDVEGSATGHLSRVTLDVYFFLNNETNRNYLMQSQTMHDYGEMTFKQAAAIIKKKHKK